LCVDDARSCESIPIWGAIHIHYIHVIYMSIYRTVGYVMLLGLLSGYLMGNNKR